MLCFLLHLTLTLFLFFTLSFILSVDENGVVRKSVSHDVFTRLNKYISTSHTTLPALFQRLDTNGDGVLSKDELGVLLGQIAPELTTGEREHVFAAFAALDGEYHKTAGTTGDAGVSLHEFQRAVRQAQEAAASLQGAARPGLTAGRHGGPGRHADGQPPEVFEKLGGRIRGDMRRAKQLFDALDIHNKGYLKPTGVVRLLNKLVPGGMSPEERRYAVAAIGAHDRNGDGRISFGEFCKAMRIVRPTIRKTPTNMTSAPAYAGYTQMDVPGGAPFLTPTGPVVAQHSTGKMVVPSQRPLARPMDWDVFALIDEHMRSPDGEHIFLKMFAARAGRAGTLTAKACAETLHEWIPVDLLKGHVRFLEEMLNLEAPFVAKGAGAVPAHGTSGAGSIAEMAQRAAVGVSGAAGVSSAAGMFTVQALMRSINECFECARQVKSAAKPAGGAENPAARAARAVIHASRADAARAQTLFEHSATQAAGGRPPSVPTSGGNATRTLGDVDARALPTTHVGAYAALLEPGLSLLQRRLVCSIATSTDAQGAGQLQLSFANLQSILAAAAGQTQGSGKQNPAGKSAAQYPNHLSYGNSMDPRGMGMMNPMMNPYGLAQGGSHGGVPPMAYGHHMEPEDVIAYAVRKNATLRDAELTRALKDVAAKGDPDGQVDASAMKQVDQALNAALLRAGQDTSRSAATMDIRSSASSYGAYSTAAMGAGQYYPHQTVHAAAPYMPNPYADLTAPVGSRMHPPPMHAAPGMPPPSGMPPGAMGMDAQRFAATIPDYYRYHGPTGMLHPRFAVDASRTAGALGEDTYPIPVKEMEELDLYHRWTRQRRELVLQQYDLEQQRKMARMKQQKANDLATNKLLFEIDLREKKLQDNLDKVALALGLKEKETAKLEAVKDGKPAIITPDDLKDRIGKAMDAQKNIIKHYQGLDRRRNLDVPYGNAYLQPQGTDEKRYPRPDVAYGMEELEKLRRLAYERGMPFPMPMPPGVPPPMGGVPHYPTPDGLATSYPPAYAFGAASPNEYARMLGMMQPFLEHAYPPPPQHTDPNVVGALGGAGMHPLWQRMGYPVPEDLPNQPEAGAGAGAGAAAAAPAD